MRWKKNERHCRPKANLKRHINSILWHKTRILITNFARLNNHQKNIISLRCFGIRVDPSRINGHHRLEAKRTFSVSFRFVSITITPLCSRFPLSYAALFFVSFSGTTHLGNKNKGREADTIEKHKKTARKTSREKKECLMIFLSLNKIFWFCSFWLLFRICSLAKNNLWNWTHWCPLAGTELNRLLCC